MPHPIQPETLALHSHDIAEDKKQELLRLFPELRTEGGKIDLERLKLALGDIVDVGKERYGMNWPGKADCFKTIQAPSLGTLRPCHEESVNFDTTENLIIEGDNLEVLKLLQKSYLGKIKMIYIDPPYNTGNDFIYPDDYTESLQTYLEYTGQVDSQGKRFSTNTEADGRFHSKWLNMMYPRLYLAQNLLREDGLVFISIDDHEVSNLRKLCDDIFGEDNFVAQLIWNSEGNTDNQFQIKIKHEYILLYCKNRDMVEKAIGHVIDPNTRDDSNLHKGYADNNITKNNARNPPQKITLPIGFPLSEDNVYLPAEKVDEDFFRITTQEKFVSDSIKENYNISNLPVRIDDMVIRDGKLLRPCTIYSGYANIDKLKEFITNGMSSIEEDDGNVRFYINRNGCVRYRKTRRNARNILSVIRNVGTTERNRSVLKRIGIHFDYPKPIELITYLTKIGCEENGIILDFFAGSGTTAHAVFNINKEDGGNRKFIVVQLPEPCEESSESFKAGCKTITDVSKERVRRIIQQLNREDDGRLPLEDEQRQDRGFRVFKLAESNFKTWNTNTPSGDVAALQQRLELHIDHIRNGRTAEDILYEILLKSGFSLTTPVEQLTLAGKTVYSVAGGALFICLERQLTLDLIRAMAEHRPERVVCLDNGFTGNDQLKANAVQIFKTKGVTSFKTV